MFICASSIACAQAAPVLTDGACTSQQSDAAALVSGSPGSPAKVVPAQLTFGLCLPHAIAGAWLRLPRTTAASAPSLTGACAAVAGCRSCMQTHGKQVVPPQHTSAPCI